MAYQYHRLYKYGKAIFICIAVYISTLTLTGCKEDDEMFILDYDSITVGDGEKITVIHDSILTINTEKCLPVYTNIANPNDKECLKRFIVCSDDNVWVKTRFSDLSWIGLKADELYYVKKENYYHIIPGKCDSIAIPYALQHKKMGLIFYENGECRIGYTQNGECYAVKGTNVNCQTVLLYIGYDSKGNKIDKYFPCSPYDLEWNYSWLNLNDIL